MNRPNAAGNFLSLTLITLLSLLCFSSDALAAQAKLAWSRSTDPAVTGYKVYHGTKSRDYSNIEDAKDNLSFLVTTISETIPHYFAVTAYSPSAESDFSEELICCTIKVLSSSNGQITPSGNIVLTKGSSQTFSITPIAGFSISDVLVDGISVGAVSQYVFSTLDACHTISAVFTQSQYPNAGDERWAGNLSSIGEDGESISALTLDGKRNVYAGGTFSNAGEVEVNHVAKWNGSVWSAFGLGMNGAVHALALDEIGNLYAGGDFSTAGGGIEANRIAKWNGSEWSALGSGMNSYVRALYLDGSGNLYAGGSFTTAGGVAANHIAKWNGSEWSALGSGLNSSVRALYADGSGSLYAGGSFTMAGGVAANHIAKWNGNEWSALGSGMNGYVNSLAMDKSGSLYAGGSFTMAGGVAANHIAKWNGNEWSALGSGMNSPIRALAVDENGNLFAGGSFTSAGSATANKVAKWNGSEWSALGSGTDSGVQALAVDVSGNLYAGGDFTNAGGESSSRIAKWLGRPALAVDFLSGGIYFWEGSWEKTSSYHPSLLAAWGDRLVANFSDLGLYLHDGSSWKKLSSLKSAESMVGIADSLYADFGESGVYRYKEGWSKINSSNPTMMTSYGEKLVANFPDTGIWEFNGSAWKRISSRTTAEQMVGIERRLFVDFGPSGIYRYDGSWVRITVKNPKLMHAFGTALVASIDSGSTHGLYLYRNNTWRRISSAPSVEGFASTRFTLYADRGAEGIWKYEKKGWKPISSQDPERIAIHAGKLVADLPAKGLYLYSNPGWSNLSANKSAGLMQGVLFK
ncbi:MAG: hypothetical protein AB9866_18740 [Syntrophobacteraceae bacterium]